MAGQPTDKLPRSRTGQVHRPPRSHRVVPAVMAAEGIAFAVLLGLDGSPGWQAARVVLTLVVTLLAAWFTRRAGRAGQGAAALLLGGAGTAAGGAVAGAHLAKAGPDAAAVVAVIVLVTGLCLLTWGAVALVRAIPGWWRLLAIPVAWVLLELVLFPLAMGVIATNRPPAGLGTASPAAYGLTYHNVGSPTSQSRPAGSRPRHPRPCVSG